MPINYDVEYSKLRMKYGKALQKIEELEAENKRLDENMWAAKYCNPTEDLRLARLRIKELEGLTAITGVIEREKRYIAAQDRIKKLEREVLWLESNWVNPTGE